jgi:hypothetical protein
MHIRLVTIAAAAAVVLLAVPSSAAPEHTATLSRDTRTASWTSDFRIGPYFGEPFDCGEPHLGCDEMLIRLAAPGALTIRATQGVPATRAVDGDLIVDLYRSDAAGTVGKRLTVSKKRSADSNTISARDLPAGFYLVEVKWYDLTFGDYTGRATLVPRGTAGRSTSRP